MQRFLSASAHAEDGPRMLQQCLAQLGEEAQRATLGFVYATTATVPMLAGIMEGLRRIFPRVQWSGCVGEGICSSGLEYYDEPAIALLLSDIAVEDFCLLPATEMVPGELPAQVRQWCEHYPDSFGLLHAVPTYIGTSGYLQMLQQHAPGLWINGGLSSSFGAYRHIDGRVLDGGISGVLISPRQPVLSAHSQGCTPISGRLEIDEAHQNMVLRLEGQPALQRLKQAVGEVLWRDQERLGKYIFIGLPIELGGGDDYLVRNLMGLDLQEGSIAAGDLMEGQRQLLFCRRDGNTAYDEMLAMLRRLKEQLAGRTIRGGIYISCIGRGRHQFSDHGEELRLIGEVLGDFPLAGFFASGEFFRSRLYSYTGVLSLFL